MSINLNIDTYLLCSMFNISRKQLDSEYSGMPIVDIMKTEAQKGNRAAANFDSSILSDPVKLIQLFELNNPNNKYAILSNMNQNDLENLLPQLSEQDLIQGLNYFSKDKLIDLMGNLPQQQLLNYTFDMFSEQHVMAMMPEEQVNNMLMSKEMNKQQEINCLQTLDPEILNIMITGATGQQAAGAEDVGLDGKKHYDREQMIGQISTMPDKFFQKAMLSIPPANKQAFVYKLAADNPKLYNSVSAYAFTDMIDAKKDKQAMLRSANVINTESLIKMVSQLPKELTSVVLTQMDTTKFANAIQSNFKGALGQVKVS